jgi:ribosomal protein L32
MAFWPVKKTSKSRTRRRTSNWIKLMARKLKNRVTLNATKTWLAHFVDENGMYKGRQVIAPKTKKQNKTRI